MQNLINLFAKYQRHLMLGVFLLCLAVMVYALGFSTDIYALSYYTDPYNPTLYVEGAEIYLNAQPFNRALLILSLAGIVLCAAQYVFFAQSRRLYQLSNYITCGVFSCFNIFLSIYMLVNLISFRAEYLMVDFEMYREVVASTNDAREIGSPYIFDIGIVISVLVFAGAALVILNGVCKYLAQKAEARTGGQNEH